jgi:hypothetical protein
MLYYATTDLPTFPLPCPTHNLGRRYMTITIPNSTKCAVNNIVNSMTVAKLKPKTIIAHAITTCLAVHPSPL